MVGEDYFKIAKDVLKGLKALTSLNNLQLTSVAKAIEAASNETIKIIFRGEPSDELKGEGITGITISQECEVRRAGVKEKQKFVEHLIYYSEKHNPEDRRFFVAHELGHIFLHHLTDIGQREREEVKGPKGADFYVLEFTEQEEAAADIFATILVRQRPKPKRPRKFVLPCIRDLVKLKKRGLLSDTLADLLPNKIDCVDTGHPSSHCFEP
jgi:hypothetical protein